MNLDLKRSWMIGDSITDVEAGKRAGVKTILLAHLKCDLCHLMAKRGIKPDLMAKDLAEAVGIIKSFPHGFRRESTRLQIPDKSIRG